MESKLVRGFLVSFLLCASLSGLPPRLHAEPLAGPSHLGLALAGQSFAAATSTGQADAGTVGVRPTFFSALPAGALTQVLVSTMSDRELLGQVFMLGYDGDLPSPEILAWIRDHGLGGVKIFGWNATSLRALTKSITMMQTAALGTRLHIPLLIATDQEGGWVRQIKGDTSVTPGNMAIGATNLPSDAYKTGLYIGRELKSLGVNMDFAPDADVYTNPRADVIGSRSFGSDPTRVGLLAVAFYRGLREAGIISAAKHYPGHGDAAGDSHLTLPVVNATFDQIWSRDLVPFRMLIADGLPAIMSGHLAYPKVTGNRLPATLSKVFESEILRKRLGFHGLIVTDDMLMTGVEETGLPLSQLCIAALEAGDDVVMISQTPALDSAVWTRLLERMKEDPAFRALIAKAAERVLRVKLDYLRGPNAVPLHPDADRPTLPDRRGESFFFEQACRSVTLIKGGAIPIRPIAGERILLAGQYHQFLDQGKLRYPQADTYYFSYSPFYWAREREITELRSLADRYDLIVFCLANPHSMQVLQSLKGIRAKVIVMSTLSPVYLRGVPWISSAIAVYGFGADSFAAGFAVLAGDFRPVGKLPITLLKGEF